MNNQEAIALLRNLEDSLDSYCELNEDGKKAFHMAIESLELFGNSEQLPAVQPDAPDTNVGDTDTISRAAAIDELARTAREKFNLTDEFNHYLAGLMDGETAIRQLPSAQPQRMRGRWVKETIVTEDEDTHSTEYSPYWKCSECGLEYSGYLASRANFCLQCGADMRESINV